MALKMASPSKPKKSQYNTNCSVFGCHSRKGADRNIHFHSFPDKDSAIRVKITTISGEVAEMDKRKAWEKVLSMSKPVTKYMRVCSKHFQTEDYLAKGVKMKQPKLKRFAVPSQNLPKKRSYCDDSPKAETSQLRGLNVPNKRANKEKEAQLTVCLEQLLSAINTESSSEGQKNMYLIEETQTKVNFSLKKHPFIEESITVKRESDDFDNRKTANEVDQDLDQKPTIQIHSHIKDEEDLKTENEVDRDLDQKPTIQIHSHIKTEEEELQVDL